jgi:hypothetical protein
VGTWRRRAWQVQFRITARSYDFHYGDGTSSGPSPDPGGTYPTGQIRHTYTRPQTATVRLDAVLGGQYRINTGPWTDLDTTADLPNEPTTTLTIRQAQARPVTH